jgi:TonB family protein
MFYIFCLTLLLALAQPSHANVPPPAEPTVNGTLERLPEPVGGMSALAKAVKYPEAACNEGIQGVVLLKVTLGASGEIQKTEVSTSVRADIDQAAVDAVKSITWSPAKDLTGKNIAVTFLLPVTFKLAPKP